MAKIVGAKPAVFYQSKMSLDLDGGYIPCVLKRGSTNQCATSFRFDAKLSKAYEADKKKYGSDFQIPDERLKKYFDDLFVQSDRVPFIVLPSSDAGEFSTLSGVKTGDLGVVVFNNRVVPVIVADRGPYFRIGEASLRVFEEVNDTRCKAWTSAEKIYCERSLDYSIPADVTTIVFPQSAFPKGKLTPANIADEVRKKALNLYAGVKQP